MGVHSDNFLSVYEGRENPYIYNTTKLGHHGTSGEKPFKLPFCWWADDGQILNAGLTALLPFRGSRPELLKAHIL